MNVMQTFGSARLSKAWNTFLLSEAIGTSAGSVFTFALIVASSINSPHLKIIEILPGIAIVIGIGLFAGLPSALVFSLCVYLASFTAKTLSIFHALAAGLIAAVVFFWAILPKFIDTAHGAASDSALLSWVFGSHLIAAVATWHFIKRLWLP